MRHTTKKESEKIIKYLFKYKSSSETRRMHRIYPVRKGIGRGLFYGLLNLWNKYGHLPTPLVKSAYMRTDSSSSGLDYFTTKIFY